MKNTFTSSFALVSTLCLLLSIHSVAWAQCPAGTPSGTFGVSITAADLTVCPGTTINFTGSIPSNHAHSFKWNFGDTNTTGDTAVTQNASYAFTSADASYIVTLTTIDTVGKDSCVSATATVKTGGSTAFASPSGSKCAGASGVFTAAQTGSFTYLWTFSKSNGSLVNTANATATTFIYPTPSPLSVQSYTVTLAVTQAGTGTVCTSAAQAFSVGAASAPFTQSGTICPGSAVAFTGSPSGANSYAWTAGAAGSSATQNPSFTFPYSATPQNYNVILTTTASGNTCKDTAVVAVNAAMQITVFDSLNFKRCVPPTGSQIATNKYDLVLTGTPIPNPAAFVVDFGDGTATQTVSMPPNITGLAHTYNSWGSFPLTITQQGFTCPSFQKNFDFTTNFSGVSASLVIDPNDIYNCNGNASVLVNNNSNTPATGTNYQYTWGDGQVDTSFTKLPLTHSYLLSSSQTACTMTSPDGFIFDIQIKAFNACGSHTNTSPIYVMPAPIADISVPSTTVCVGQAVTFTNNSCPDPNITANVTYLWEFFGVTTNKTTYNVAPVTYNTPGTYKVRITVSTNQANGEVCGVAKDSIILTVVGQPNLNVSMTPSSITGCLPMAVSVVNTTTPTTNVNYSWSASPSGGVSFSSATAAQPAITFTQAGNYAITLTAQTIANSTQCGTTQSTSQSFTVKSAPVISLTSIPDQCNTAGSATVSITPQASVTNGNGTFIGSTQWTFSGAITPSATSFSGSTPPAIAFGAGQNIQTITAQNECGTTTRRDTFMVNQFPNAASQVATNGVANSQAACISAGNPMLVSFTNASTPNGANNYQWSASPSVAFSPSATAANPQISLSQAGVYTITLSASNNCGVNSKSFTLTARQAPTVTMPPTANTCGSPKVFSPTATFNTGFGASPTFNWTFTGGTPASSTSQTPGSVSFGTGQNIVIASVTNECTTATARDTFIVTPLPIAAAAASATVGCAPFTVNMTNSGSTAGITYNWSVTPATGWIFTGGTSATSANPNIQFTQAGAYTITQNVSNICGNNSKAYAITVKAKPSITLTPIFPNCAPLTVTPTVTVAANGGTITQQLWDFGSGSPQTASGNTAPSITFPLDTTRILFSATNECGISKDSIIIQTFDKPLLVMPADTAICTNDGARLFSASPQGGTWSGNAFITTSGVFNSPSSANTFNAIYTFGTGNCQVKDTFHITTLLPPSVNAGADQTVCQLSSPITLPVVANSSWSDGNATIAQFNPITNGNFPLTLTTIDPVTGCDNTDIRIITVNPKPVVAIVSPVTYCITTSLITLTNYSPITGVSGAGVWSGTGVSNAAQGIINTSLIGNDTIPLTYIFTNTFGCKDTGTLVVQAVPPIQANAGADTAICVSAAPFQLAGFTPSSGGTWSGTGVTAGGVFDPAAAGVGAHTLTYTYGIADCQTTDTRIVTVNPLPTVNAGASVNICENALPITLSPAASTSAGTRLWSGSTLVNVAGQFSPVAVGNDSTVQVLLTVTDANGCINTNTRIIFVRALPTVNVGADRSFCLVSTPQALGGVAVNQSGTGIWTGGGITDVATTSGAGTTTHGTFTPSVPGVGTGYPLTFTFTNAFGCASSDVMLVDVINADSVSAGADSKICANSGLLTLTGYYPPNATMGWSGAGVTQGGVFNPAQTGAGTFTLTYTIGSGTCQVSDTKIVLVDTIPQVSAGNALDRCISTATFSVPNGSPSANGVGVWSGTGVSNNAFSPAAAGIGTFLLTYTFTDQNTCTSSATRQITVNALPIPVFSQQAVGCKNGAIPFSNTSTGAASYLWKFGDGGTATQKNPTHSYTATGSYSVRLIAIGATAAGCKDSISKAINIIDIPTADFAQTPDTACAISLPNGTKGITATVTDQSTAWGGTYAWSFGNGNIDITPSPATQTYLQGINNVSYSTSLTLTNQCGTHTKTKAVVVRPLPQTQFGLDPLTPFLPCSPAKAIFVNTTKGSPDSFFWNFGNGLTSTQSGMPPLAPVSTIFTTDSLDTTYTAILISTNVCGADTDSVSVTIKPRTVKALFKIQNNTVSGCAPLTLNLTNVSNGDSVRYEFGDGGTFYGTNSTLSHTYLTQGTYMLRQFARNACSFDTFDVTITILPQPTASFAVGVPRCADMPITFTNTTANTAGLTWNFGVAGATSNALAPTYLYANAGSYTVSLIATTGQGCSDTATQSLTINQKPKLNVAPAFSTGCAPFTTSMLNTSAAITAHSWNFGDSTGAITKTPTHTFADSGQYVVTYIATDNKGCKADTSFGVFVKPTPVAAFTPSAKKICGAPATVSFSNQSTGINVSYIWDFGDGTPTTNVVAPTHTFAAAGTYIVRLIASNPFSCADTAKDTVFVYPQPSASFSLNKNIGCYPLGITANSTAANASSYNHTWSINGVAATGLSANTTYTVAGNFPIQLKLDYQGQCPDSITQTVSVGTKPVANFNFADTTGNVCGGAITLVTQDTSLNMGAGGTYFWNFGNGFTANTANASANYNAILAPPAVTYPVKLVVTNAFSCKDSLTKNFTQYPQPVANFTLNKNIGCYPLGITANSAVVSPNSYNHTWSINGATITGLSANTTYTVAGNFPIKLKVDYQGLCPDSITQMVNVGTKPVAQIAFTDTTGSVCGSAATLSVSGQSSQSTDSYLWNFGNGQTATTATGSVTYSAVAVPPALSYPITLIVGNLFGCADTAADTLTVYPQPVASFTLNPNKGCYNLPVTATSTSSNATNHVWDFGNGVTATGVTASTQYIAPSIFTIKLKVDYQGQCPDSATQQVKVSTTPKADFTYSIAKGNVCGDSVTVQMKNNAQFASKYFWNFGNGVVDTAKNPSVTYLANTSSSPDTLKITLTALNDVGCSHDTTLLFILYPKTTAAFALDTLRGCPTLAVTATNQSSNYNGAAWNFGNSTPIQTTLLSANMLYTAAGIYTVTLIVNNYGVCFDTATQNVKIGVKPTANIVITDTVGSVCGGPVTLNFDGSKSQLNHTYLWTFNNGNPQSIAMSPAGVVYQVADTYAIQLVVTDTVHGCKDTATQIFTLYPQPLASFTADTLKGCYKLPVTVVSTSTNATNHFWDFGDGTTATGATYSTIYSTFAPDTAYIIRLIVNYMGVCPDTAYQKVEVGTTPIAGFTLANTTVGSGCGTPVSIQANNISQYGSEWLWRFGDGATSPLSNPAHQFAANIGATPDTFLVRLRVRNYFGCEDSFKLPVVTYPKVTAQFVSDKQVYCTPAIATFDGSISTNETTYAWDFGDGTTSTDAKPLHIYDQLGSYAVRLIASIGGVCSDTVIKSSYINVLITPIADFDAVPVGLAPPDGTMQFVNQSLLEDSASWKWNFGDTFSDTLENPVHRYMVNGPFDVTLTVSNGNGCADTATKSVTPPLQYGLQIPNSFSPTATNIPAEDRLFKPVGVGLKEFHIVVYSVEGNKVWESTALDTEGRPTEAWDGTDSNGIAVSGNAFRWDVVQAVFRDGAQWQGMIYRKGDKPATSGTVTVIK